jgi:O-antigen ligase
MAATFNWPEPREMLAQAIGIPAVLRLAVPIAIVWITLLALEANNAIYAAPAAVVLAGAAACGLWQAALGRTFAIVLLVVVVLFGLNLSFRMRAYGEVGLDWQNGVKLATWVALVLVGLIRMSRIAPLLREPLVALTACYAAFALISATWSEVPVYSAANALGLFAYLSLACIVAVEFKDRANLPVFVWALAAFVAASVIAGFVVPDFAWGAPSIEETTYRLKGLSIHPNALAQLSALLVVLVAATRSQRLIGLGSFVALTLLGLSALSASGGRTSLIGAVGALILVGIRNSSKPGPLVFVLAGGFAFLLATAAITDISALVDGLGSLSRTGSSAEIYTLTGRTDLWSVAWSKFMEKPVFGWGYNGTEALMARSMGRDFYGDPVNPHNSLLQCLLSVGIVGTIPMLAMVGLLLHRFMARPDISRDLLNLLWLLLSIGEVEICGTPGSLTFVAFWTFAREGQRHCP